MWWAGPAVAHDINQTNAMFNNNVGNRTIVNVSQCLRVGTWPWRKHLFPICRVRMHFSHWGLELSILRVMDQMMILLVDLQRQIKYVSVLLTFPWYLLRLSRPLWIASLTSENLGRSAILVQVSFKNSKTGIVRKALGSFELENVCFALAGSLKPWTVRNKNVWFQTYL